MGAHLVQRLEGLRPLGIVGDIRGKGLMIGVELVEDPATKQPFPPETKFGLRIGKRALQNGLLLRFDPHWIAFGPPLIVTERTDRPDGGHPGAEHPGGAAGDLTSTVGGTAAEPLECRVAGGV